MPTLNELMTHNTTFVFVVPPRRGRQQTFRNGRCGTAAFTFDMTRHNHPFQMMPTIFVPRLMTGPEIQRRNESIALFQNPTLRRDLVAMDFNMGVEQDAFILDDGTLHDLRGGQDSRHSPDRVTHPNEPVPSGRRCVGYFHTHPFSHSIRPPTPSSDWNPVPGIGAPGSGPELHFMIEGNRRVWGFLQNRHAFIVGRIEKFQFLTINPGSSARNCCWHLR
jgi:hypothetical protein